MRLENFCSAPSPSAPMRRISRSALRTVSVAHRPVLNVVHPFRIEAVHGGGNGVLPLHIHQRDLAEPKNATSFRAETGHHAANVLRGIVAGMGCRVMYASTSCPVRKGLEREIILSWLSCTTC
jgi:hypothetical protein